MADLYISRAQPNPPGKDASRRGVTTNTKLNEEWIELEVVTGRYLEGDDLSHVTFGPNCRRTGVESVVRFGAVQVAPGQKVRVHTGSGSNGWVGSTYHVYAGRGWFVWNNDCGDTATLSYGGSVIDWAAYDPYPPEGELVRLPGTNRLVPGYSRAAGW